MSDKWKDRIIRGGVIVVGTMGIIGAMVGLTGIMAWYPGVGRASVIILAAAACIGLPRGRQGQRHHPRRGRLHRTGMRHRRHLPQPVADE